MIAALPFPERVTVARRLVTFVDRHSDGLRDELGVAWTDQMQAAIGHAYGVWRAAGHRIRNVDPRWRDAQAFAYQLGEPAGDERHVQLLAATIGCRPCHHLRGRQLTPAVVFADLNHRLAVCERCVRTTRKPVLDRRCEVCDADVADNTFTEMLVQVGNTLICGNVGSCCRWLLDAETSVMPA